MLLTLKLVTVFLIFFLNGKSYGSFENRILYGKVVDPGDFDWSIVQIKFVGYHGRTGVCTGTVISKRHILTALHCIQDETQRKYQMFYFNILKRYIPQKDLKFHVKSPKIDIAIIEFPEGTVFEEHAHKIAHSGDLMDESSYQYLINRTAIIAGYGIYDYDGKVGIKDKNLRIAKVPIWPSGWCRGKTNIICTSDYSPYAVEGDSGGPVFFHSLHVAHGIYIKAIQFGVLSFAEKFSKYNFAVPLYPHCGWIAEATNGEANCHIEFPAEN